MVNASIKVSCSLAFRLRLVMLSIMARLHDSVDVEGRHCPEYLSALGEEADAFDFASLLVLGFGLFVKINRCV